MSTTPTAPRLRSAPVPKPPSARQLEEMFERLQPGFSIYSPHDDWLAIECHGIVRWCPPDLGGVILDHPVTGEPTTCDGTLTIRGRKPMLNGNPQRDSSGKEIQGQDAASIIKFITEESNYGQMGVTWLPHSKQAGDPTDDEVIDMARRKYRRYQEQKDEGIIAKRQEFMANWAKNPSKKGQPCPPPTAQEMAAMDRIQERKAEVRSYRYNCDFEGCIGYATDDKERFQKHLIGHGLTPDLSRYDGDVKGISDYAAPAADVTDEATIAEKAEADRPQPRKGAKKG